MASAAVPVQAAKTGTWTATTPHTSVTSNGITVTMASTTAFTAVAGGTMVATNFWNDPFAAVPTASIPGSTDINFTTAAVTTQTITITFNKAVTNPVLHVQRMGGSTGGLTNSSSWNLTGSNLGTLPTITRLSGNPQFRVVSTSFFRTSGITAGATGCSVASATATADDGTNACGSVRVNGTGITSLTYTVTYVGGVGAGDGLEMVWSTGGSRIALRKQSTFGTRVFNFSGSNGVPAVALDTAAANPATSAFFNITDHRQPITITEVALSDYTLTGATCADQSAATVTSTLAGLTLSIPAASYRTDQDIICTFSNRKTPAADFIVTKSDGATTAFSGANVTYSVVVTNSGPDASSGAVVTDVVGTGLTCAGANAVTITGDGVPAGSYTIANLTGAGIALGNLAVGQSATLTYTCQVN